MLITAWLRWRMNTTGYLVAGIDGAYYPLQVRSLLENFRLGYPDMPLVFLIEAFFVKIFILFGMPLEEAILLSVKSVDSFLPPLVLIPVYLLSKELRPGMKTGLSFFLPAAFTLWTVSLLFFTSSFTKNAVAVVFVFLCLYYLIRLIKYGRKKDVFLALAMLVLCTLTHFGSAAVLVFYILLIAVSWFVATKSSFKRVGSKRFLVVFFVLVALFALVAVFDPGRLTRVLLIPLKVFEAPAILFFLEGFKSPLGGIRLVYLILVNAVALITLVYVFVNKQKMEGIWKALMLASAVLILFLTSPLIGIEWSARFSAMYYVPMAVLLFLLLSSELVKPLRYFLVFVALVLVFFPFVRGLPPANKVSIDEEAYAELQEIKSRNMFGDDAVIIARQDLRMTAGWMFRTKTAADFSFTVADFEKYDPVFILKQIGADFKKDESAQFKEPHLSAGASKVYAGENFEVFRMDNMVGWNIGVKEPLKIMGTVVEVKGDRLVVKNDMATRPVEISSGTKLFLDKGKTSIEPGMYVQVWGENTLFDLTIEADLIQEVMGGTNE